MKYTVVMLVVLLGIPMVVTGQQTPKPWLSEKERARYETLRRSGLEALYNLDYEKARQNFKQIAQLYPHHPAGSKLLAASVWIKTLYQSRRLQTSLYNSETFYADGEDKVDPKIVEEFRTLTRDAKRLTEARLKQYPRDIEALDFLAATAGLRASFLEAVERKHFAALREGSEAVDRHKDVLKLDPNYVDAELTIGIYEYVIGSLPLPVRILVGITGARGSKKRGLERLERVAKEGRWTRDDAKSALLLLYTREGRYRDIVPIARELGAKYPRNYIFRLEEAKALISVAEEERKAKNPVAAAQAEKDALKTFEDLLSDPALRDTIGRALDLIHFKFGEVLMTAGYADRAAKEFMTATQAEHADPGMVTMAHLYAARAYDVAGKRNEALAQYQKVLDRPNVYAAHDQAKRGLREPYRQESARNVGG
ncbi:MAG TPA: hypothetical protein VMM84_08965 [Pyrinomonadaceae bacterium]|nr:hypothetical protein [Pyrinomonadaceae bacterium]